MEDASNPRLLFLKQRADSTFEEIPVIDFSDVESTDPLKRRALVDQIRDACINATLLVKNHNIPQNIINAAIQVGKSFFALPESSKMDLDIHKTPNFKGYTPLLGENTDPNGKGDLHEGFDFGWEELENNPSPSRDDHGAMSGSNVWPDIPGFRETALTFYHRAIQLGRSLFPLFALALDLPENFFDDNTTKPAAIMRLLHYPPQAPTIRDAYDIGGLQVKNNDGKWVDAVPIPGTFVVNLGDQFARWTNDVFKSTLHRVINKSGRERYSIPLFFGTNYDVLLEPIPSCVSEDFPPKYKVVTAGEYVKSRLEATYSHSSAPSTY
ncbi:Clavaminate synthase-like protein [Marasmius fiardii PR-910]|nr:Clavaminate synthase-like protein [Marasmius fiardii PR-910]